MKYFRDRGIQVEFIFKVSHYLENIVLNIKALADTVQLPF